jgi:hypothetical protein
MKTPYTFNKQLAQLGWPVVTRDGRKAEVVKFDTPGTQREPLLGFIHQSHDMQTQPMLWMEDGSEFLGRGYANYIMLSSDLDDPLVRKAVEAAHKAGMPICYSKDRRIWYMADTPEFYWAIKSYLPACLLEVQEVAKPAPQIATGHNPDKLTVEQVGEGWRLLTDKENLYFSNHYTQIPLTQFWDRDEKSWHEFKDNKCPVGRTETQRTRLTREELAALRNPKPTWTMPNPPEGREWYGIDFTEEDLPEGWRPLLKGERMEEGDFAFTPGKDNGMIINGLAGCFPAVMTRTHVRTRRPLLTPPKPWDCAEDVPRPVCWIRSTYRPETASELEHIHCMILTVSTRGITYVTENVRFIAWEETESLKVLEYSTDRETWKPCTKEAAQ